MSFSVHAKAFVPPSSAAFSPSHLRETAGAASAGAKNCVCVAFYENGRCPYGTHCEHAHRFSELTQSTQTKLLGSVPVESIPAHFFGYANTREEAPTDAAVTTSLSAYGHYSPTKSTEVDRTVPTRRRTPGKNRLLVVSHIGPQTPASDTASVSSRTSSSVESQRLSMSGAQASKGSSSPTAAATMTTTSFDAAAFKMHLPLRCRYPHRAIPGTYYDVLALPRDVPYADIIAKYRAWQKDGFRRMRLVDPVGAEAVDRMIVEARNVLGNPALRAAYDQQLPSAEVRQQPWPTNLIGAVGGGGCGVGTMSTITTPSKRCTQGQSSTTSSTSEAQHGGESSNPRLGFSGSNYSIYHADIVAPAVTISSMRSGFSV
ncbi:hypothetical protein ABB37_00193 [Leptomonas pyrrhocoris]|uniref:C3H1-type domain-containing protein n=1 Tax=Leptomonas pyrrhocoris TaxID=157538 RepID=A0A0N0E000_LEPPY|nr:hypothetical protein ABB37_00193 [Leptomonas pyrrhocoris]KPA85868.1 hypothetical protein ABB37_00193 [Leptomonas pyrrhocoris]|eukprot:XP_015664307.1 hypothetical protein ABB37_00193 [Leptomonas pyrrhocoris]